MAQPNGRAFFCSAVIRQASWLGNNSLTRVMCTFQNMQIVSRHFKPGEKLHFASTVYVQFLYVLHGSISGLLNGVPLVSNRGDIIVVKEYSELTLENQSREVAGLLCVYSGRFLPEDYELEREKEEQER
jgi:hypothetical protein